MSNGEKQGGAAFPLTRWSLVAQARGDRHESARALDELLTVYRPVLASYLLNGMRLPADQAEDLVQGFIAKKILQEKMLERADRGRGKFRSFLLKVLTNYVIGDKRKAQARKRGPSDSKLISLDEDPDLVSVGGDLAREFDVTWARQVLSEATTRMRSECSAKKRDDLWRLFDERVLRPTLDQAEPPPYETLVSRFGLESPSQAANLLITAKRMFQRVLTEVVRDTVEEDAEVEAEIRELRRVLAGNS